VAPSESLGSDNKSGHKNSAAEADMYSNRLRVAKHLYLHGQRRSPIERSQEIVARSFYRDLLGGRQVGPTGRHAVSGSLWFLVGATLIEVSREHRHVEPLELPVESPASIAERCWDAGYTVRPGADDTAGEVIVTDPFGRDIALTPRLGEWSLGVEVAG
jgi:hypothetical protein